MAASPTNIVAEAVMVSKPSVESKDMGMEDINGQNGACVGKITGTDFEYFMWKDKAVIGRNSSHGQVDVSIGMSSYISRRHLQISRERDRYFLKCLGKNGVFVDGQFQRLGAEPLLLKPSCTIRFPSTNIRLYFSIVKANLEAPPDTNGNHEDEPEKSKLPEIPVPALPELEDTLKSSANVEVSPPISKPFVPVQDPVAPTNINAYSKKAFLSAPPSPTGTISAANSCPASPRGGTSHLNISDNLKRAAAYAAKVVQQRGDNPDGNQGNESPPREDQKPPYSYAQLIIQAIASSKNKHLTLSGIYAHITTHYPYYRTADKGWQNSIRHNLSLNRYFVKVPRSQEESGKGSFWRIEPASEQKLVEQAWRKRRQRGVPCFRAPINNISATRSAPASPVHSNPISPQTQQPPQENQSLSQPAHQRSISQEQKPQFVQLPRFPQSAPGSPVTMSGVVMTTGNNPSVIASMQQQNQIIMNTKPAVGKVIWPVDVTKPPVAFSNAHIMNPVTSNGLPTSEGVIRTAGVTDPQKLSILMPQQQVVMVAGQQPVSLGTIITPAHMSAAQPVPQAAPVIMKRQYPLQPPTTVFEEMKRAKIELEEVPQDAVKTESN